MAVLSFIGTIRGGLGLSVAIIWTKGRKSYKSALSSGSC